MKIAGYAIMPASTPGRVRSGLMLMYFRPGPSPDVPLSEVRTLVPELVR